MALFVCVLVMWFSPKIASAIDILLRPELRRGFGGAGLFILNYMIETVYSILLCPILWFGHTIFLVGLLFGREIGWIGQTRDDHAVPFTLALRNLWPHTLLGCAALGLLAMTQPAAIPYALFLAAGPALAIPFAMITAWPRFGSFLPGSASAGCPRRHRRRRCCSPWRCPRSRWRRRCRGQVRFEAVFEGLRTARSIIRSLRIYYGDRSRAAAMDRLYGGFVRRGDLVFDVGAHVGDRVASFRRLGARVVAVEPQPAMVKVLELFYGRAPMSRSRRWQSAADRHDEHDDQCR